MSKNLKYFLTTLILSSIAFWGVNVLQNNFENYLTAQISEPLQNMVSVVFSHTALKPELNIDASSAISAEIFANGNQKVLFKKNVPEPLPIASLTKLMAALIVFEDPEDFDFSKIITISKTAANQGNTPNYGNLKAGEKYTLDKLVELMLVYSSNDAAYAISEIIGTDNFLGTMNQKAVKLGMSYTYFVNPTGLDPASLKNPGIKDLNYSTAQDLVKLSRYIMENYPEIFRISSQSYDYDSIENGISNLILPVNQKLIGGKTGFTKNAGGSILFVFQDKNGNVFISAVLGTKTEEGRIVEMQKLIDWLLL